MRFNAERLKPAAAAYKDAISLRDAAALLGVSYTMIQGLVALGLFARIDDPDAQRMRCEAAIFSRSDIKGLMVDLQAKAVYEPYSHSVADLMIAIPDPAAWLLIFKAMRSGQLPVYTDLYETVNADLLLRFGSTSAGTISRERLLFRERNKGRHASGHSPPQQGMRTHQPTLQPWSHPSY